jgi:hypothetical protein
MARLPSRDREDGLNILLDELKKADDFISVKNRRLNLIEKTLMIFSVITSGALWLLIGDVFGKVMIWIGAVISTVATGLTIYMEMSQLKRDKNDCLRVKGKMMDFLAEIRSGRMNDDVDRFWRDLKRLQTDLDNILINM